MRCRQCAPAVQPRQAHLHSLPARRPPGQPGCPRTSCARPTAPTRAPAATRGPPGTAPAPAPPRQASPPRPTYQGRRAGAGESRGGGSTAARRVRHCSCPRHSAARQQRRRKPPQHAPRACPDGGAAVCGIRDHRQKVCPESGVGRGGREAARLLRQRRRQLSDRHAAVARARCCAGWRGGALLLGALRALDGRERLEHRQQGRQDAGGLQLRHKVCAARRQPPPAVVAGADVPHQAQAVLQHLLLCRAQRRRLGVRRQPLGQLHQEGRGGAAAALRRRAGIGCPAAWQCAPLLTWARQAGRQAGRELQPGQARKGPMHTVLTLLQAVASRGLPRTAPAAALPGPSWAPAAHRRRRCCRRPPRRRRGPGR